MKKNYAYFDVIGTKENPELLDIFWSNCAVWAKGTGQKFNDVRNGLSRKYGTIEPCIITFTDSAILTVNQDLDIDDFYKVAINLREDLLVNRIPSYCIINRDEERTHPNMNDIVEYHTNKTVLSYANAWGSGPVWINIYNADLAIKDNIKNCEDDIKKKEWKTYQLYCVGKDNIASMYKRKEKRIPHTGLDIFALE